MPVLIRGADIVADRVLIRLRMESCGCRARTVRWGSFWSAALRVLFFVHSPRCRGVFRA